jgi:hypothetical protein
VSLSTGWVHDGAFIVPALEIGRLNIIMRIKTAGLCLKGNKHILPGRAQPSPERWLRDIPGYDADFIARIISNRKSVARNAGVVSAHFDRRLRLM